MRRVLVDLGIILFLILSALYLTKENILLIINQSLPPREAGLLGGILVGDKSGFEKSFYENLKNSGLVHLVIVSGSNVMLLVGGWIESMAGFLGRKKSIILGLVLGWGYANLVGWQVPVVRAMFLISVMYWSQLLGRKYDLTRGIIFSVAVMMIGEITILTSLSFWLSMMAFLAVVTAKRFLKQKTQFINKTLWETFWVSLWVTPILALIFGKISLISPVTNALVVAMMELITVIGMVGVGVGLIFYPLGKMILWILYPGLGFLGKVVEWGGAIGAVNIKFNWLMLWGWYVVLFYFLIRINKRS